MVIGRAYDTIEKIKGFDEPTSLVGGAWAVIRRYIDELEEFVGAIKDSGGVEGEAARLLLEEFNGGYRH